MTRIVIDPPSLFHASRGTEGAAKDLLKVGLSLAAYPLPSMPPHVHGRVQADLKWASKKTVGMSVGLHHLGQELHDRAQMAIVAGGGDVFGGMMSLLAPALQWLYGGKDKPKDGLAPGGMFGGGHDVWKRRHMDNKQWSDTWWKGKGARNMPWNKSEDKEWLDAGVKLWSKDLLDAEANVWQSKGDYHNIAALGASAKAGASFKFGRDGIEAGVDGTAAAYLLRGDVGFDKKYGDANAGVFVGGLAEAKANLRYARGQLHAEAGGKAFVGGEAHASGHAKALGVKAGGSASVSYGLGAEAKGEAAVGWDKVKLKGKVGLTFGLGGSVGVDLEWSPADTVRDVGDLVEKIPKPKIEPPWEWDL